MDRLIIGVGSWDRRDDGAGLTVAQRLQNMGSEHVVLHDGEASSLMGAWEGAEEVVIVDAMSSGRPAGSVVEFDAVAERMPAGTCYSTHAFGVEMAVELARALDRLPPALRVVGIEGGDFAFGQGLTREVADSIDEVVEMIRHA